jgi:hypothetical protein
MQRILAATHTHSTPGILLVRCHLKFGDALLILSPHELKISLALDLAQYYREKWLFQALYRKNSTLHSLIIVAFFSIRLRSRTVFSLDDFWCCSRIVHTTYWLWPNPATLSLVQGDKTQQYGPCNESWRLLILTRHRASSLSAAISNSMTPCLQDCQCSIKVGVTQLFSVRT